MKLSDKVIQDAIRAGRKIKRLAWGHCEFTRHIKHAHIPSRDPKQFAPDEYEESNDWVVCE